MARQAGEEAEKKMIESLENMKREEPIGSSSLLAWHQCARTRSTRSEQLAHDEEQLRHAQMSEWCRKHGTTLRPKLTQKEREEIHECFALLDADGSGALDVEELYLGFKALGLNMGKDAIRELMREVDNDDSGEIELPEFEEMMLRKKEMDTYSRGSTTGTDEIVLNVGVMARSFRRKKMLEALSQGQDGWRWLQELRPTGGPASTSITQQPSLSHTAADRPNNLQITHSHPQNGHQSSGVDKDAQNKKKQAAEQDVDVRAFADGPAEQSTQTIGASELLEHENTTPGSHTSRRRLRSSLRKQHAAALWASQQAELRQRADAVMLQQQQQHGHWKHKDRPGSASSNNATETPRRTMLTRSPTWPATKRNTEISDASRRGNSLVA